MIRKTAPFLVILATMLIHAGAIKNELYWDDRPLIVEGQLVHSLKSIPTLFAHELWYNVDLGRRAPEASMDTYRPLTNVSFLFDNLLWNGKPTGFHLTNLLIHLLNLVLLYVIAKKLTSEKVALLTLTIFAFHPLTAECAEYVAARTDSLANLFVLFGVFFLFFKQASFWRECTIAFAFLCGVFVKETALIFILFWLLSLIHEKSAPGPDAAMSPSLRPDSPRLGETLQRHPRLIFITVPALTLGLYVLLRLNALGKMKAVNDSNHVVELFINYPHLVVHYFRMFFVPTMNMPMQHFSILRPPVGIGYWLLSSLFYLVATIFFYIAWKRRWIWSLPVLWICTTLAPPFFATSLTEVLNPRYLYPATMGLALCLAQLLFYIEVRSRVRWLVGAVFCSVLFFQSVFASPDYRTGQSFYRAILRDNPHHVEAEYNLANTLYRDGNYYEATLFYREVLTHKPNDLSSLNNLGNTYLSMNQNRLAYNIFKKLIMLSPNNEKYQRNFHYAEFKINENSSSKPTVH